MNLPVEITLPFLWGEERFHKTEWGYINYLVGPNGTGKTLFAEQLKTQCQTHGLKPRYLNAERLSGFERTNYVNLFQMQSPLWQGMNISQFQSYRQAANEGLSVDAFIILREKIEARIRIEASLSELFGRRVSLVEEGGFLKPKVQHTEGGTEEYDLKERESHGLKEIITLLTFLYDDEYNCLILDEPELHLHPQLQAFFLQEARKLAGDPRSDAAKKCFFFVTHSPYLIDIRTIEDLRHCVVFQQNEVPAYVDSLDEDDARKLGRLLPRLNTHHKQFFFASRPIFVEGYFDQQIFTLIQERRGFLLGASGTSIIDVSGKEELDLFFRLSKSLKINAQIISDLDVLFKGNLRRSVSHDDRCKIHLQNEGLAEDLMTSVGEMERHISICMRTIEETISNSTPATDSGLEQFLDALASADTEQKKRYIFLLGMQHVGREIKKLISDQIEKLNFVEGRLAKLIRAFEECNVYLLPEGELENHLPSYEQSPYKISDKVKQEVFKTERDLLLDEDLPNEQIRSRYDQLTNTLDKASQSTMINMDKYLTYTISDWIHKVQSAVRRGHVTDIESLTRSALVEWSVYSRILDVTRFSPTDGGFSCSAKLKPIVDEAEREVVFDADTVPNRYKLQSVN